MKRYKTIFILTLSSLLLLAGCTDESLKEGSKVSLRISAVIPAIADSLVTRAGTETGSFKVALSTTAGEYAGAAKDYTATASGSSYTFSPTSDGDLKIALLATSTPLTIYGQVGDIPYYYSKATTTVNRGAIADLKLTYAYAKVAVRVMKAGKTEVASTYNVNSDVLSKPAKNGSSYEWNTTGAAPGLTASNDHPSTTNIAEDVASSIDFTQAGMEVTPGKVAGNADKLFTLTETTAPNKTYNVSSLTDGITIEAGKAYLFTIDLDKEAVIIQTDITPMDKDEFDFRTRPGIYSSRDFKNFRDAWNMSGESGISSDLYVKWMDKSTLTVNLLTDIDLRGESWTPIKDFTGIFEGGSHTISNLTVTDASDAAGLFGTIKATSTGSPAIIQHLNVENATVSSSSDCGVICGSSDNSRILDCNLSGVVKVSSSSGNAGGIVGNVTSGSWLQRCNAFCSATSSVTGSTNAGGIVGNTAVDVFGCAVNNISTISATSVGSIAGTGDSGTNLYSCIACNVSTLTGTCSSSPFGNATTSNCYFTNVAGKTSGDGIYVKYMEYMSGRIMDDFNNGLYTFYEGHSSEPYATKYKFVGAAIPASFPPTLKAGTPEQRQERTPGIYTGHELVAFSKAWNSDDGTERAKYLANNIVTIMNDIDMKGIAYTPINKISGTINGANGKQQTIANLSGVTALINNLNGSLTIKDLILKDAVTSKAGFLVDMGTNSLTMEYCKRIGGSTIGSGSDHIGGLVGTIASTSGGSYNLVCIACSVEDMTSIEAPTAIAGGIIGRDCGKSAGRIIGCAVTNIQNISGSTTGSFIGYCNEHTSMNVRSCIAYNNKIAGGTKGVLAGSRSSDPNGGTVTLAHCYWNKISGPSIAITAGSRRVVTDCVKKESLNDALSDLNTYLKEGLNMVGRNENAYIWQLVEGKDYPVIVRNTTN